MITKRQLGKGGSMKKQIFAVIIICFFFVTLNGASIQFLKIKQPPPDMKAKGKVLLNRIHLEKILQPFDSSESNGLIELADPTGIVFAKLGKYSKGKLKWSQKMADDQWMLVKIAKRDMPIIQSKITDLADKPGLQIQITDVQVKLSDKAGGKDLDGNYFDKSKTIVFIQEITCAEIKDLSVTMKYPITTRPGDKLDETISINVRNNGTIAAKDIQMALVVSKHNTIPIDESAYKTDMDTTGIVKLAGIRIPVIDPGKSASPKVPKNITLPDTIPPGNYFLGIVVDSTNALKETNEKNNSFVGSLIIAGPIINKITLSIPDTEMIFQPKAKIIKIVSNGSELSMGKDWRWCKLRTYIFQMKHITWPKNYHWEINTRERVVWQIRGAGFCKTGGNAKELGIKVQSAGGSDVDLPTRIVLKMKDTRMIYDAKNTERNFNIISHGNSIAHPSLWVACELNKTPHIFQFKCADWKDFCWEIDTLKKVITRSANQGYCRKGDEGTPLDIQFTMEE